MTQCIPCETENPFFYLNVTPGKNTHVQKQDRHLWFVWFLSAATLYLTLIKSANTLYLTQVCDRLFFLLYFHLRAQISRALAKKQKPSRSSRVRTRFHKFWLFYFTYEVFRLHFIPHWCVEIIKLHSTVMSVFTLQKHRASQQFNTTTI